MDNSSEDTIPHHLKVMSLATTPQQAFETADRMFLQAATIRECADELHTRVQSLCAKAENMEKEAIEQHRQGVQDRKEISKVFDDMLKHYTHILPQFTAAKPHVIPEITLAVEEGRALAQHIYAVGELLHRFDEATNGNTEANIEIEPEISMISTDQSTESDATEVVNDTTLKEDNTAPTSPPADDVVHDEKDTKTFTVKEQLAMPDSTDDEFYEADGPSVSSYKSSTETGIADLRVAPQRPPRAAERQTKSDDEMVVSERKRKPRASRGYRKKRMLSTVVEDGAEISDLDLDNANPSKSTGAEERAHKRNKGALESEDEETDADDEH